MDWPQYFRQFPENARPALCELVPERPGSYRPPEENLFRKLAALAGDQRRDLLRDQLRSLVARILGLASSADVDMQQGFFQLGMDSLTSMEMRNRLQQEFSCSLAPTLAFKYPTVLSLADYLLAEVFQPAAGPITARNAEDGAPPAREAADEEKEILEHAALSEEQAEALLLEKLENLHY
jgi:acyl carrier protein